MKFIENWHFILIVMGMLFYGRRKEKKEFKYCLILAVIATLLLVVLAVFQQDIGEIIYVILINVIWIITLKFIIR